MQVDRGIIESMTFARKLAVAGIATSFIYFLAGMTASQLMVFDVHSALMGCGLVTFAASVNLSFWTSVRRIKYPKAILTLHLLAAAALPISMIAGVGFWPILVLFSLTGATMILMPRWISLVSMLELYTHLAPLTALLATGREEAITLLAWSYAVPLIYAVSVHAVPKTYRYGPIVPLIAGAVVLNAAVPFLDGLARWLMWGSMGLYLISLKPWRLPRAVQAFRGDARRAHLYLVGAYLLLIPLLGTWPFLAKGNLETLHLLLIGFVGLHVFAHAPMMIPVILSTSNARRFTLNTLISLLLAALLWPISRDAALVMLLSSTALVVTTVKP